MTNIIPLPEREKQPTPLPKQRVFHLGFVYRGPMLCQEIQEVYLKRHGKKDDVRKWSIVTYGKYDEADKRDYSLELATCEEDDVPEMLDEWYIPGAVTFEELRAMGWACDLSEYTSAKIYDFSMEVARLKREPGELNQ